MCTQRSASLSSARKLGDVLARSNRFASRPRLWLNRMQSQVHEFRFGTCFSFACRRLELVSQQLQCRSRSRGCLQAAPAALAKTPVSAHGRRVHVLSPTSSRCEMTQIVMPGHTNGASGVLFGGVMMQWIDVCAGVSAMRHAGGQVVTASIDRLDFLVPVHVGDIVVLQSRVNYIRRSSMEVGCRVEVEDPATRTRKYTTKAYLTFVSMGPGAKPCPVEALVLETDEDRRRSAAAKERGIQRLRAAGRSCE